MAVAVAKKNGSKAPEVEKPKGSAETTLQERVDELREKYNVPGVSVGILHDGIEEYAYSGVTSVENPLPVDENTLFQIGSTGKTYTATAIMRLVEQGKLSLDDKVKKHIPEFRLKDKHAEKNATILNLLNHTAGWYGDQYESTGDGDDSLAILVKKMATFGQTFKLGTRFSYNNVSLSVAGRVIEKVTGKTYEQAMKELIFEPLGQKHSFFFLNEIATRRFAVGHNNREDKVTVHRPLHMARNGNPAGGISSTPHDQLIWAKFHMGDGRSPVTGKRVLKKSTLQKMQKPTVKIPSAGAPQHLGISWFLSDEGRGTVTHGGNTGGQNHGFVMVPKKGFAISILTNSSPGGSRVQGELTRWALEHYAGIKPQAAAEPKILDLSPAQLREYAGVYGTDAVQLIVKQQGDHLTWETKMRPATIKALHEEGQEPPPSQVMPFKITEGDGGVVTDGPGKGMRFMFSRVNGKIDGIELSRFAKKEK